MDVSTAIRIALKVALYGCFDGPPTPLNCQFMAKVDHYNRTKQIFSLIGPSVKFGLPIIDSISKRKWGKKHFTKGGQLVLYSITMKYNQFPQKSAEYPLAKSITSKCNQFSGKRAEYLLAKRKGVERKSRGPARDCTYLNNTAGCFEEIATLIQVRDI